MFGKKRKQTISISPTPLVTIKEKIRILIIDDVKNDLIDILKEHNWVVRHKIDLENADDTDVIDSHIILVDVNGIGFKLGFKDEGLGVAVFLKKRFPEKKIVLYSTTEEHKSFHEAFRISDKVLYKDGSKTPFITTIEELALEVGDWNQMVKYIYQNMIVKNRIDISFDELNTKLSEFVTSSNYSNINLEKIIGITSNIASIISAIIGTYLSFGGIK